MTDGNLGPREQRKRLLFGAVMLVIGLAAAAYLLASDVSRWWRLALFLPFALAAHGLLQARAKTRPTLAARGTRNLDAGEEPIPDPAAVTRLRAIAGRIRTQTLAAAAVLTVLALLVPGRG